MIARYAIDVRHGKQQFCQADAVRPFVDDIPQNIELVPAAEPDLFQQTTEQIVIAVNIGNAIIHISIIPSAAGKSNTLPKSGARNMRRRSMPPMRCGVRRSLQTQAYPARRARTPSAFCPRTPCRKAPRGSFTPESAYFSGSFAMSHSRHSPSIPFHRRLLCRMHAY